MEFVVLNGKIEYRGNGGDQERATVGAGKTVTLDFNAGTGTIPNPSSDSIQAIRRSCNSSDSREKKQSSSGCHQDS